MDGKEGLREFVLFIYSLNNLEQKKKVKVIRELFGYRNKINGKEYSHEGLLQKTNSEKLAQNVIMVPLSQSFKFSSYFNEHQIQIQIKEVYTKWNRNI